MYFTVFMSFFWQLQILLSLLLLISLLLVVESSIVDDIVNNTVY